MQPDAELYARNAEDSHSGRATNSNGEDVMPTLTTDEYGKHMGCNQQVDGGGFIIEGKGNAGID